MRQPILVVNSIGIDSCALGVGQQPKCELPTIGEAFEHLDGIATDRGHLNTRCFDLIKILLQLNQLLLTVRSPIGRSVEDEGDISVL